MPFRTVRADSVRRIAELRQLHRMLVNNELVQPVPAEHTAQKGLFIVGLYAIMEFVVTELVRAAVAHINSKNVLHTHIAADLMPMICDPGYTSAENLTGEKKWRKRHELALMPLSVHACQIREGILSKEVMNTGISTIELIFSLFSVDSTPACDRTAASYLEEVRERRNAVSHGRESASEVGRRFTVSDLGNRLQKFEDQITYMILSFEDMAKNKVYVNSNFRSIY